MITKPNQTPVEKSLAELGQNQALQSLPVTRLGTTYTMAQQACWVSFDHFAVGRWDGSVSVFNKTGSTTAGPVISIAVSAPADQGIQMLGWIATNTFISSNDSNSIIAWNSPSGTFQDLVITQTIAFDATYGIANCSAVQCLGSTLYIVTGHENGYLLLWTANTDGSNITFLSAIDLRSANPVNPWGLQNIRGVAAVIGDDSSIKFATGSENGEVCIVEVPSATILSRTVFNPQAKRGINAISTLGQNLLVANCSVGPTDKNLWFYWIDANDWSVNLRDSKNLIVDMTRAQVFNFDVGWGMYNNSFCFFSATEEGQLWMGNIVNDSTIQIIGNDRVAVADLGAALAPATGSVVYAAYNVTGFDTSTAKHHAGDPNRIDSFCN